MWIHLPVRSRHQSFSCGFLTRIIYKFTTDFVNITVKCALIKGNVSLEIAICKSGYYKHVLKFDVLCDYPFKIFQILQ